MVFSWKSWANINPEPCRSSKGASPEADPWGALSLAGETTRTSDAVRLRATGGNSWRMGFLSFSYHSASSWAWSCWGYHLMGNCGMVILAYCVQCPSHWAASVGVGWPFGEWPHVYSVGLRLWVKENAHPDHASGAGNSLNPGWSLQVLPSSYLRSYVLRGTATLLRWRQLRGTGRFASNSNFETW